jgi:phage shock protein A
MSEFCVKCAAHEANLELVCKSHYEEVQKLNEQIKRLEDEVDRLSFDLAFFNGNITNLSCNDK